MISYVLHQPGSNQKNRNHLSIGNRIFMQGVGYRGDRELRRQAGEREVAQRLGTVGNSYHCKLEGQWKEGGEVGTSVAFPMVTGAKEEKQQLQRCLPRQR